MENSCGLLLQTIEKRALQFEGQWLLEQVENRSSFAGLIGGSEAMRKVYRAIEAVAGSMANVVIRGESGVGKELVARAIVQGGERRDQPYICLNCSALPKGMRRVPLQARDSAKPGMVEAAHAGTLFLDEITTLNHGLQSKLLRVLQGRTVQRQEEGPQRDLTFGSSPRPMTIWKPWCAWADSARICITASTWSRS